MAETKDCFVIAPIGDEESETRKRSDKILKHVISPAVAECGYKAIRADQISDPGMINNQVIQHIVEDPLVIADLTEHNPNVFYELAIRHALRKPFIQIIEKGEQLPFDVAGARTIYIDHTDLDSAEEAREEIIAQIKSLEADPSKLKTPISISLDLQNLRRSDDPEQRSLADVLSVVTEIRNSLAGVEKKLDVPQLIIKKSPHHHDNWVIDHFKPHSFGCENDNPWSLLSIADFNKNKHDSIFKDSYQEQENIAEEIVKNIAEKIAKKDELIASLKKQIDEFKNEPKESKE